MHLAHVLDTSLNIVYPILLRIPYAPPPPPSSSSSAPLRDFSWAVRLRSTSSEFLGSDRKLVASATSLVVHPVTGSVVFSGTVGSVVDVRMWLVASSGEDKVDLTAATGPLPSGASFVASLTAAGALNWIRLVRLTRMGAGLLPPRVSAMAADVTRGPSCFLIAGTFGGDGVRIDDLSLRDRPTDTSEVGTGYFRAALCGPAGAVVALRGFWLNSNGQVLPPVLVQRAPADYLYQMVPVSAACGPSWCAISGYAAPVAETEERETHGFTHFVSSADTSLSVDPAQVYTMMTNGEGTGGALLEASAMGPGCGSGQGCLYLAGRFNGEVSFPRQAMAAPLTVSSSSYPFCKSSPDRCKSLIPAFIVVVDMARRLVVSMERVLALRWSSSYLGAVALARVWDEVPGPATDPKDPYLYGPTGTAAPPSPMITLALRVSTETAVSGNTSVVFDQAVCQSSNLGKSSSGGTLVLAFNATSRSFELNRTMVILDPVFSLTQPGMQGQVHLYPGPAAGSLGLKSTAAHRGDSGLITWATAGILLANRTTSACVLAETSCTAVYAAAVSTPAGSVLNPTSVLRVGAPGTLGTVIFAIVASMVSLVVIISARFAIREPNTPGLDRIEEELRLTRLFLAERNDRLA